MGIPGEDLDGVYGGNEILENNSHPDYTGKTVVVSGGGNVAMDTSRTIKKLGAERVVVIYRRSETEMPAEKKEIKEAKEEGVEFLFQNNIIRICGDKKVEKIECVKTELVQKEGETRKSPVNIEGSNYFIDIDYIMMAVGSKPEGKLLESLGLELDKRGRIAVDKNNMTSKEGVFAGGDLAGTRGTVAWASRSGRDSAKAIMNYLEK
jgi:glutamate synthase (NADPH/NADH) small chain